MIDLLQARIAFLEESLKAERARSTVLAATCDAYATRTQLRPSGYRPAPPSTRICDSGEYMSFAEWCDSKARRDREDDWS